MLHVFSIFSVQFGSFPLEIKTKPEMSLFYIKFQIFEVFFAKKKRFVKFQYDLLTLCLVKISVVGAVH